VPQPGNPQALNRYSYVLNNPLRYTDPTGNWTYEETDPYTARNMIAAIWTTYGIRVTSGDSTPSIQELKWTQEVLSSFPMDKVSRDALKQVRWQKADPGGPEVGGRYDPSRSILYMYDSASCEDYIGLTNTRSVREHFKWSMYHELTHSAQWTTLQGGKYTSSSQVFESGMVTSYAGATGSAGKPGWKYAAKASGGDKEWTRTRSFVDFPVQSSAVTATLLYEPGAHEDMALAVGYYSIGMLDRSDARGRWISDNFFPSFVPPWR